MDKPSRFATSDSEAENAQGDIVVKARYWHTNDDGQIQCDLCPHGCVIPDGKTGRCKVRMARHAELVAAGYGRISSAHVDPMEKKPLYHFHPGSSIFSVGGWGCNLACVFCQNWSISQQADLDGYSAPPELIIRKAKESRSVGIAYTYNEPLISFEFIFDCAKAARANGLRNVLVTNGYVCSEPAAELLPWIDALNIDIKSFDPNFYRQYCHAGLEPVLAFAKQSVQGGCHVEVTNLIIPDLNDNPSSIRDMSKWIKDNLGANTVLHLSGYHPDFKMKIHPTPIETLEKAHAAAKEFLAYVYIGNARTYSGQDTGCPACGEILIRRRGYTVNMEGIRPGGECVRCGRVADLIL